MLPVRGARMVPTVVPAVARAMAALRGAAAVQGTQAGGQALESSLQAEGRSGHGRPDRARRVGRGERGASQAGLQLVASGGARGRLVGGHIVLL